MWEIAERTRDKERKSTYVKLGLYQSTDVQKTVKKTLGLL